MKCESTHVYTGSDYPGIVQKSSYDVTR